MNGTFRNNGLGRDEWLRIGSALQSCALLEEIADFGWSRQVLPQAP